MLAPVSVHADYFHQGIGSAMHKMGIEKVKEIWCVRKHMKNRLTAYKVISFMICISMHKIGIIMGNQITLEDLYDD